MRFDHHIGGLSFHQDWVSETEELAILAQCHDPGRHRGFTDRNRVDRYGAGVPHSGYTAADRTHAEIPAFLRELGARLPVDIVPDAVTIGWYLPGQSMRPHVDNPKSGPAICVLNLVGPATMRFSREGRTSFDVAFERRMLLVMRDEARWDWKHEILPVVQARLSVVFRRATAPPS